MRDSSFTKLCSIRRKVYQKVIYNTSYVTLPLKHEADNVVRVIILTKDVPVFVT